MKIRHLFTLLILGFAATAHGQGRPIGYWRAHMPYTNAEGVATDGVTLYAISEESFFTFNAATNELSAYSKVEGMSDVGMTAIGFDATTGTAVLAYQNANIDLFKDGTFYNIPDIKLTPITGTKQINDIYTLDGMAYISTNFGVVVLNLDKKETKETYSFINNSQSVPVTAFCAAANYFYALTANGLYRADKNNPNLQAFSSWQQIDAHTNLLSATTLNNELLVCTPDSIFTVNGTTLDFVYESPYEIIRLDPMQGGIYINEYKASGFSGFIKMMNASNVITDSVKTLGKPLQTVATDELLWFADEFNGLGKNSSGGQVFYKPNGPASSSSFDILANNKEIWVASGGFNDTWTYLYNTKGISKYENDQWRIYDRSVFPVFSDSVTDFIVLATDPVDGSLYAGSYRSGLFVLKPDGSYDYEKNNGVFESTIGDPGSFRISGLCFDLDGNLWINQSGAPHDLVVKTRDGQYYKYSGSAAQLNCGFVTVDDYNQKWYIVQNAGVAVYDDNHTPEMGSDDRYIRVNTGKNLPSNVTYCVVKDKEGAMWIGTDDGIGIVNCPDQIIDGNCAVEKRIVQYDQFAGYLFQTQKVKTIAVDGANRKWIGTTNGVWLISASGDKIIYRFTDENSPLPSNNIQKIAIDPVTGDVYIGTASGLVSFHSTATEGDITNSTVVTYPNPVPSSYKGTIAIRGLAANADVRITDINGQLIYRTKALGGQAVWNGMDYNGRRPQSGVYLIFVSSKDGAQTAAGKMVFME